MKENYSQKTEAREQAFIIIFQKFFNEESSVEDIIKLAEKSEPVNIYDYAKQLSEKAFVSFSEIDKSIEPYLKGWTLNRISKVVYSVLRVAVCEILYFDDVPYAVTINEAVELCKKYAEPREASFANALLGSIVKELESSK